LKHFEGHLFKVKYDQILHFHSFQPFSQKLFSNFF
jgi:hypothetical protein